MTPDELKKFLAPETHECIFCKAVYGTAYQALKCAQNDEMRRVQEEIEQKKKQKVEQEGAKELQKVLEENLG